jgi:phosphohistidine phosphatase
MVVMKTLYLVRHAKSSWDDDSLADRDRPLADRGRRQLARMGPRLAESGVKPEAIVSSPAKRALATAKALAEALNHRRQDIVVDDRIYPGDADGLLALVRGLDDGLDAVMLVGHNPGLSDLANRLAKGIGEMPTCAVIEFQFDIASWADATRPAAGHRVFERH